MVQRKVEGGSRITGFGKERGWVHGFWQRVNMMYDLQLRPGLSYHGKLRTSRKRNPGMEAGDKALKKMQNENTCSWQEISAALPLQPHDSIGGTMYRRFLQ